MKAFRDYLKVIESEEISYLDEFKRHLSESSNKVELDEQKASFEENLEKVREKRRKVRAMLYDVIVERDNLIKSHLERVKERRLIEEKNLQLDRQNGVDLFLFVLFLLQIAIIICYIIFLQFPPTAVTTGNLTAVSKRGTSTFSSLISHSIASPRFNGDSQYLDYDWPNQADYIYSHYINIALMVFIGFNFFMSLLKRFTWGTITLNMLIGSFAVQWGILAHVFFLWAFKTNFLKVQFTLDVLIHGTYVAAACLISHASLVGRINEVQALVMVFFEAIAFTVNFNIAEDLGGKDPGGASWIFLFASSFGVTAAWMYGIVANKGHVEDISENRSYSYWQGVLAFLGAIVIWIMFPSFNSVFSPPDTQSRVIGVTVLSLCSSTVATIASGKSLEGNFFIKTFINSTLIGGIFGASGFSLVISSWQSMLACGFVAFTVTVFSDRIRRFMEIKASLVDTQGILGSILLASLIACLVGIIAIASQKVNVNSDPIFDANTFSQIFDNGDSITVSLQAKRNTAMTFISLGIGAGSGFIVGLLLLLFRSPHPYFTDKFVFKTPLPDDYDDF